VPRTSDEAAALATRLGHRFADQELLRRALTHRSASGPDNERLEYLGDAVLGLLVAEALYGRVGDGDEGALSRLRASLVNERSLAGIAAGIGVGDALVLGQGERKSGGWRRESILADALEALIGAVYVDAGLDAARGVVRHLFGARLERLPDAELLKDPKTRLQELLQGQSRPLPEYGVVGVAGADHDQTFRVRCALVDGAAAEGEGRSRREAEQAAAAALLATLQHG
jgi:ribonuclease-3